MLTHHFYARLTPLTELIEITDSKKFVPVPDHWHIVITDVVNSTEAIEAGRYKDINLLGAASIVSILNIAPNLELPFVFGGDGAAILIPPSMLPEAREALLANQCMARTRFNLNLRVGIVPVSAVVGRGYPIKIAKLKISEHYYQAIFTGGGLTYATELIKTYSIPDIYTLIPRQNPPKADFSGLECRWQDIQPSHEEVVSLHILAVPRDRTTSDQVYREILSAIQAIYGPSDRFHPLASQQLGLTFNPQKLAHEVKVRTFSGNFFTQLLYLCQIWFENLLGALFMRYKLVLGGVNWGIYPQCVVAATDYQKFDDTLRMIISGNSSQRQQLIHYLDERYRLGDLVYGLHISNRVIMTCLVFERNGRQVHFIDGADGGLAIAAKALKQRMHRKALNWRVLLKMLRLREKGDRPVG